ADLLTITAVNDAPVLDASKTPALPTEFEDAAAPSGPMGALVASLVDFATPSGQVDNVTDADSGALLGIAITGVTPNGTGYYSVNNGATWTALGSVSTTNALLLAANAMSRVYVQPAANVTGTLADALTFRAWDQTSGGDGGTADTSTAGAATAFSTATD